MDLVFLGSAPHQHEDLTGKALTGRAGYTLRDIIKNAATDAQRQLTWVATYSVACCPRDPYTNAIKKPAKQHVANCQPRLQKLVEITQPRGLVLFESTLKSARKVFGDIPTVSIGDVSKIPYMSGKKSDIAFTKAIHLLTAFIREELCDSPS